MTSTCEEALTLGDDLLVMSQRLLEWVARAPEIEEDVALANIALDLLGQARMLLTRAGSLMEPPRTEDDLAYFRDPEEFRCARLVQRENGDFAVTMTRLLGFSEYLLDRYDALRDHPDPTLAAIAAKALPEVRYHHDHARLWTTRLEDGTPESQRRMAAARAEETPFVLELLRRDPAARKHTADLTTLLAEMQVVARAHPGATW